VVATTAIPTCPTSNGTNYVTSNGEIFLLECFVDHAAGDLSMVYVDNYGQCASACSNTVSCVAFSWQPPGPQSPCYMKSSVGTANTNQGVWGGKFIANVTLASSPAASVTTTTTPTWSPLGCYNDTGSTRALSHPEGVVGGYTNMTISNCQAACQLEGFTLAGVEVLLSLSLPFLYAP
jgi:hypothetical protein